jgi:uncharacterized protein GlcG (DUF336 family)
VATAEGGVPVFIGGAIVGAIGVAGVTGAQDEKCAEVGAAGTHKANQSVRNQRCAEH